MRQIPDSTGRFPYRLYLTKDELEQAAIGCSQAASPKQRRFGLGLAETVQIGRELAGHVELEADLPDNVDAQTRFFSNRRPELLINSNGAPDTRLKMTIAHEIGHLVMHEQLFKAAIAQHALFEPEACGNNESSITSSEVTAYDWMEWQASFFGGALLLPAQELSLHAFDSAYGYPLIVGTAAARRWVQAATADFEVSEVALVTRARQLSILGVEASQPGFFS